MKIAIAQLDYHIGNFEGNLSKILSHIDMAKEKGADIVAFGELAVCGYPPRDFLEFRDFIRLCEESIEAIRQASYGIGVVFGAPTVNPVVEGKDLYNSVYFVADQEIVHVQHKALLPTYDIFDEYRYFEPGQEFRTLVYKSKRIALTVCEDIWNVGNENPLYTICPLDELIKEKPDFVINVSASPFSYNHAVLRKEVLRANTDRYGVPMFYVNHIGAQTEIIFDGGSIVISGNGAIYDEMPYFVEAMCIYDLEEVTKGLYNRDRKESKNVLIHDALVLGVKDYFGKLGFKKAIIGLSGGVDSALTTYIATRALGAENVHVLLMPSQYSSDHSISDSLELVRNLGITSEIIPIESVYNSYMKVLNSMFQDKKPDITEENIQARIRGMLLMAMSNKFGYILLNTSNKSEAAVGYGTLYGDMCGGLSVIGDVYKMEVYELCGYINRNGEVIPQHILDKAPSAELRPDQKDSDSLPEYKVLDPILYQYIEHRKGPVEIIEMGFDKALVNRILRLVNINEFKRYQTPPTLRVSAKAFGMGRRMPIVAKYLN